MTEDQIRQPDELGGLQRGPNTTGEAVNTRVGNVTITPAEENDEEQPDRA